MDQATVQCSYTFMGEGLRAMTHWAHSLSAWDPTGSSTRHPPPLELERELFPVRLTPSSGDDVPRKLRGWEPLGRRSCRSPSDSGRHVWEYDTQPNKMKETAVGIMHHVDRCDFCSSSFSDVYAVTRLDLTCIDRSICCRMQLSFCL